MIVYVLLEDRDQTMRSQPEPIGIAVTSEEDAIKYVSVNPRARAYQEIVIINSSKSNQQNLINLTAAQISESLFMRDKEIEKQFEEAREYLREKLKPIEEWEVVSHTCGNTLFGITFTEEIIPLVKKKKKKDTSYKEWCDNLIRKSKIKKL